MTKGSMKNEFESTFMEPQKNLIFIVGVIHRHPSISY